MATYTAPKSIPARLNAYGISPVALSEQQATLRLNFLYADPHNRRIRNPCRYYHNQMAYRSLLHLLDIVDKRDMMDIIDRSTRTIRSYISRCRALSFTGEWLDHLERTINLHQDHCKEVRFRVHCELRANLMLSNIYAEHEERVEAEAAVAEATIALERINKEREMLRGYKYRFRRYFYVLNE